MKVKQNAKWKKDSIIINAMVFYYWLNKNEEKKLYHHCPRLSCVCEKHLQSAKSYILPLLYFIDGHTHGFHQYNGWDTLYTCSIYFRMNSKWELIKLIFRAKNNQRTYTNTYLHHHHHQNRVHYYLVWNFHERHMNLGMCICVSLLYNIGSQKDSVQIHVEQHSKKSKKSNFDTRKIIICMYILQNINYHNSPHSIYTY